MPAPYDNSLSYLRAVILDGAKQDALSSLETNVTVTEILDAARRSATAERRLPCQRRGESLVEERRFSAAKATLTLSGFSRSELSLAK